MEYTGDMTVAFWFSPFRGNLGYDKLFVMGDMNIVINSSGDFSNINKFGSIGLFYTKIYNPSLYQGKNLNSSVHPVIGQWYHVAAVFKDTQQKLYINGVAHREFKTQEPAFAPDIYIPSIANSAGGTGRFFPSATIYVDEVYLYNRPLKDKEIQKLAGL